MELRHLRYFIAAAEELSFRKGASRLGITQPGLSTQIGELEREIGVKLFSRRQKQIELTEAGKSFLVEARQIIFQAEKAVRMAQSVARGGIGTIRLGTTRITHNDFLPWLLRAVAARHKGIDIVPHMMRRQEILADLEDGKLDLGVVRAPVPSHLLHSKVILKDPLVAVMSDSHPLAQQKSIRLGALRNATFVALSTQDVGQYPRYTLEVCGNAGFTPYRVEEADSILSLLAIVATGRGVALLPASLAEYAWKGLKIVPLVDTHARLDLAVAWKKAFNSDMCRELVEDICTHYPE